MMTRTKRIIKSTIKIEELIVWTTIVLMIVAVIVFILKITR